MTTIGIELVTVTTSPLDKLDTVRLLEELVVCETPEGVGAKVGEEGITVVGIEDPDHDEVSLGDISVPEGIKVDPPLVVHQSELNSFRITSRVRLCGRGGSEVMNNTQQG